MSSFKVRIIGLRTSLGDEVICKTLHDNLRESYVLIDEPRIQHVSNELGVVTVVISGLVTERAFRRRIADVLDYLLNPKRFDYDRIKITSS